MNVSTHKTTRLVAACAAVTLLVGAGNACLGATTDGWTLVWADEFEQADGSAPDASKWVYDLGGGGWGNNELETYTDRRENSRIQTGKLVIEARKETYRGPDNITRNYTSARLKTLGKASWTMGRVEARIQVPRGEGIWPAFWMLGTNIPTAGWPNCGEIDVMENIGREPAIVHGTIHGPGYSGGQGIGGGLTNAAPLADDFHLYAMEWDPGRIRWYFDNRLYFTVTTNSLPRGTVWVFTQPQFILLNLAVGGNWPGSPTTNTVFPQRMVVDYVRVYARTNPPRADLQMRRRGADVEVAWPGEFPHARLLARAAWGTVWQDVRLPGTRQAGLFVADVTPGFYRLSWLP